MSERITEQQAWNKWFEIAPLIDRVMERVGDPHDFPVQPGSALAGDDKASAPYQVSHAFKQCLTVAVDHLHAARVLILGPADRPHVQPIVHMSAHAALARGALENLAVAFWIRHPLNATFVSSTPCGGTSAMRSTRARLCRKWASRCVEAGTRWSTR